MTVSNNKIGIRPAKVEDAPGIARVHISSWRETYPGILPDSLLTSISLVERTARWHSNLTDATNPIATFVAAEPSREIVGFASCGPTEQSIPGYLGEFRAIYLLRRAQRRGLGRRLMAEMARHLLDQSYPSATLWVAEGNGRARAFYEALGGENLGGEERMFFGHKLESVAYGWRDLMALVA